MITPMTKNTKKDWIEESKTNDSWGNFARFIRNNDLQYLFQIVWLTEYRVIWVYIKIIQGQLFQHLVHNHRFWFIFQNYFAHFIALEWLLN